MRYIGLSNETPFGLMKFCQLAKQDPHLKISSLQNSYQYKTSHFTVTMTLILAYFVEDLTAVWLSVVSRKGSVC